MTRVRLLSGIVAAAIFATGCSAHPRAAAGMPADVRAFVAKRTQCDHFRGEEPYDAARAAELDRRMRATCAGTDAALARLKRIHYRDRSALRALAGFDARIE
jgi:hypothetical protein